MTALRVLRTGSATPLVMIHPVTGDTSCYAEVAAELADHAVYAFEAPSLHGGEQPTSIPGIARDYLAELAPGPVALFGWSAGGVIAYEMAQQAPRVAGLALLEVRCPADVMVDQVPGTDLTEVKTIAPLLRRFAQLIDEVPVYTPEQVTAMTPDERIAAVESEATRTGFWRGGDVRRLVATFQTLARIGMSYRPARYARRLTQFEVTSTLPGHPRPARLGWEAFVEDLATITVDGNVFSCLHAKRRPALGRALLAWMRSLDPTVVAVDHRG